MADSPRADVAAALQSPRNAGIKTLDLHPEFLISLESETRREKVAPKSGRSVAMFKQVEESHSKETRANLLAVGSAHL